MQHILSFPNIDYQKNPDIPIYVVNCGYYKNVAKPISVSRPDGRGDYQVLIPINGMMEIDRKTINVGEIFLYCPHSPQEYTYFAGEGTEYYWIHFCGREVSALCASFSLSTGAYTLGDGKQDAERLVKMVIRAFSDRFGHADECAAGLLRALLALMASPPSQSSPFTKAMKLLRDPSCNLTVSELAKMYDMSEGHFIRSFKQYTGVSPNTFRITKRLEIASDMLSSTKMTVEQIAQAAGYDDPLYFSRIFKKNFGISPTEYRKENKLSADKN